MSGPPEGYVDVAERIREFKERWPNGVLQAYGKPEVVTIGEQDYIWYCAAAYRTEDDPKPGIGWAAEPVPGRTPFTQDSRLMNAETSAWGRAIVALGFETKKIASAEEVRNRTAGDLGDPRRGPPLERAASASLPRVRVRAGVRPSNPDVPASTWEHVARNWIPGELREALSQAADDPGDGPADRPHGSDPRGREGADRMTWTTDPDTRRDYEREIREEGAPRASGTMAVARRAASGDGAGRRASR